MSWRRLVAAGFAAAALTGLAGGVLEYWWFGFTSAAAVARVEAEVRRDFDTIAARLAAVAARVSSDPETAQALEAGPDAARTLFDIVGAAGNTGDSEVPATIYDSPGSVARAWVGRPSDIPPDRIAGASAFFVIPTPLGLRLVHVQPIAGGGRRVGSIAVEHALSPAAPAAAMMAPEYTLPTRIAPVALRTRVEGAGDRPRPGSFVLRSPAGDPILEASISEHELAAARDRWHRRVGAAVVIVGGLTLLLLTGPLLDRRARARAGRSFARATSMAAALLLLGATTVWLGFALLSAGLPQTPLNLVVAGATGAALAAIAAGAVARLRLRYFGRRRTPAAAPMAFGATQLLAGLVVAVLLAGFALVLATIVDPLAVNLRHFSVFPLDDWERLTWLAAILAFHVAVLWTATLVLAAAPAAWRLPRRAGRGRIVLLTLWLLPAGIAAAALAAGGWPLSAPGLLASTAVCGVTGLVGHRVVAWYRHATVAARILTLFLAFLLPALLLDPVIDYLAGRAIERLVETRFAPRTQSHPQAVQDRLTEARHEIDALSFLPDLVTGAAGLPGSEPRTQSAFLVWNATALARERLTSAVEIYDAEGGLVSRFALNLPEYTGTIRKPQMPAGCEWDIFGEAGPLGSEERPMLHAGRNICVSTSSGTQSVGMIIVHVVLFDYRTLPFITSKSPYYEVLRPAGASGEDVAGQNVEVVVYGWSLAPVYTSGRSAWPITGALFDRLYESREPFWTTLTRDAETYRVYFANDRAGIYALGYPVPTRFDRFVHLAELTTLAGAAFALVLVGTAVFTRLSREHPRVGRALLREIRASFYRKLFLAFVLASIIPVLTLALVIRTYFADLLRDAIREEAGRTAAVAQRVIQESDALWRRGADAPAPINDDVMILISQFIDQDVNIFEGARLVATSERDLFASGLLPTRTPDDVYRAIALQRLPGFVDQDVIGTFPYMIAAAPVRTGDRDAILTIPLASRQRETDREIEEIDRGVHLAALLFILLGAGIGLSLAERIADPVRRLTRATRRIARGDFDARIAVKTADELRRLVDAFNSMADELKAQRAQLERTHRLEAWAEMARQVAHEIKNPLTPIQLSAEHLQRVHVDRGEPLGTVLDSCVASILGQVRLLRQISAEFSSFASSPTARPAPVDVPELVADVVDPYRTGLAGRIEIHIRTAPPLPKVLVDRTLVARALVNIIENALHAMPGRGRLEIDASADRTHVTITVRDTGVGMDPEALARVFEPYFSTKTTGTGLGLPIARRNIEISGGNVDVESARGSGTVVRVQLPIAPAESDARTPHG
ncbi:MAG TPA: HAMP domain-containing sensor histidine kinase [Vicinamibacterales bacterium]|nr:HAMP domain-containing sensor histidine kinase [Vicinamibacterales bacterium]